MAAVRSLAMPRVARASAGGLCYHLINRGNGRRQVFHKEGDYHAFLKALDHACVEVILPVLGFCLMPNPFHLVVLLQQDGDVSLWMHWLQNAHVRRYHQHYRRSGHLWQGRFRAFPIEADAHLLTVLRYVERNPVRAHLVARAEQWLWCSARFWQPGERRPIWLEVWPVPRLEPWLKWVNQPVTAAELEGLRRCVHCPSNSVHGMAQNSANPHGVTMRLLNGKDGDRISYGETDQTHGRLPVLSTMGSE
jgi:putative transposase